MDVDTKACGKMVVNMDKASIALVQMNPLGLVNGWKENVRSGYELAKSKLNFH